MVYEFSIGFIINIYGNVDQMEVKPQDCSDRHVLGEDEVHVWVAVLGSNSSVFNEIDCLDWLSSDERARYERRYVPSVRKEYLMTRIFARAVLSRYYDVDPSKWRFRFGTHGRPEIDEPIQARRFRFNLSHTSGALVCVLANNRDVGVDIEDPGRLCDAVELADLFFSAQEARSIRILSEPDRRKTFFEIWTLKEAYIKARGEGLSIPLNKFWFSTSSSSIQFHVERELNDDALAWKFERFQSSVGHQGAVAVRLRVEDRSPPVIRFFNAARLGLFT